MTHRLLPVAVILAAALSLSACDAPQSAANPSDTPAPRTTAIPSPAPLTPAGAPQTLTAETEDVHQYAASVVRVDPMLDQNAKLYGTAGGDPAMNGLYTHIAFFRSPAEGWAVYRIGDFLDYSVLSNAPGRVDLDVRESTFDPATGTIGDAHRKLIVSWTPGPDGAPPASVTVTPAQ